MCWHWCGKAMRASSSSSAASLGVNMHLANSYIPICVYSLGLGLMLFTVYVSPADPVDTWFIITVSVHSAKHVWKGRIFDGNNILESICLSSLLNLFRAHRATLPVAPFFCSTLWVMQFAFTNAFLYWHERNADKKVIMWGVYAGCVAASAFIISSPDEVSTFAMFTRAIIFFLCNVMWLYVMEGATLSYDNIRHLGDMQVRFTGVLFTHPLISIVLFFFTFVVASHHVYGSENPPLLAPPVAPLHSFSPSSCEKLHAVCEDGEEEGQDDAEIFRLAMSSSGFKQS